MKKFNSFYKIPLLAAIIFLNIGCDQATKQVAQNHLTFGDEIAYFGGVFKLMYAENQGAFLSIGDDLPFEIRHLLLVIVPVCLLVFLFFYTFFSTQINSPQAFAFSFILGGGISNVFDRMAHGKVVDFMHLSLGNLQTGIFNMADVAIMFGLFLMVGIQFGRWRR